MVAGRSEAVGTHGPRCGAPTHRGTPCRNHARANGRCHLHQPDAAPWDETPSGSSADGEAFARARETLASRGYGPAIDGIAWLREAVGDRWPEALEAFAGFLRRRARVGGQVDDFGFDDELTVEVLLPLLRPWHRHYWRVESTGAQHIPADGPAMLVANHAGTLPLDALITRLDVFDSTGRHTRELGADLLFRSPLIGAVARRLGVSLASPEAADRLLAADELVAVWPEGYKGLGKRFKDRYELQRFGRGGYITAALRAGAPIIPTAIVGSEEIYPLLFDLRPLAQAFDLPYFPVVAQALALPIIGPFALLPLPSKWLIEYGEPLDLHGYGPKDADDPMVVFDLSDQVRGRIHDLLQANLARRPTMFG